MMRILLAVAAIAVVGLVAAAFFLYSNLDALVKDAIEHYGSQITGTSVRVERVALSLSSGRGEIHGLRVANPSGFPDGEAFRLGEIALQIDVGSLTGEPIVIDEVRIAAPEVRYVVDRTGKSNIQRIQENASRYTGSGKAPAEDPGTPAAPRRLAVKQFTFEDGKIAADLSALGAKPLETALPAIRLRDLGGAKGATPGQLGREVAVAFGRSVVAAVSKRGVQALVESRIGAEAGRIGAEAGQAVKQALDSIPGLLKQP